MNWQPTAEGHEFRIEDGRGVVLARQDDTGMTAYIPHIEDSEGTTLDQFTDGFRTFEEAAVYAEVGLKRFPSGAAALTKSLAAAVDLCLQTLPETLQPAHRLRLENLRNWLHNAADAHVGPLLDENWQAFAFDWSIDGYEFTAPTPYGRAVIIEHPAQRSQFKIGAAARYEWRITHETGAMYESPGTTLEFEEAEHEIRTMLARLDDPALTTPEPIVYTLAISKRYLPEEESALVRVRLDHILSRLQDEL
ncbi:MAG: hypothetical protein GYB64_05150 [Chloroflexi bacterium]|nr:hypothetical protein [Chloroflexota bacterium]